MPMNLEEFVKAYGSQPNMAKIPWTEFPKELRIAAVIWINNWADNQLPEELREVSGFNSMNVEGLLSFRQQLLEHGHKYK